MRADISDIIPKELEGIFPFSIAFLWDEEALIQVELQIEAQGVSVTGPPFAVDMSKKWLKGYLRGKILSLPIKLFGTPFQQQVLLEMQKIPFGKTASYADIAKAIGKERASRGVGQACGSNPMALVIGCHRVISSQGTIGGFSNDIRIKQSLLDFERRNSQN